MLPSKSGSSAEASSQDSDVRSVIAEFGRLLEIFSAQLAESLREADRECTAVGESFHDLAAAKARIEEVACPPDARAALARECAAIDGSLGAAVIALQYHDRLTQRIGHIRVGLNHLQMLLREPTERSDEEWLAMLQAVDKTYHLEWHRLARAVPTAEDAARDPAAGDADNVELF
jgi:hypothetical protein